jgi:peptidoglycan/xylan/chitin deacetylase (PgdA/CDA1 family)
LVPITFRQYDSFAQGVSRLPARPVIITFDDGYEDNYRIAFPILREMGFPAVVYMVTDRAIRTNAWDADEPQVPLLNKSQIREMTESGIEFGSHTRTHVHLTSISSAGLKKELEGSKRDLERLAGKEAVSFAYPYGELNEEVKQGVRECGYRFAVAGSTGALGFADDLLEIRRTQVFPWTGQFGFWKKTQPWYQRYKKALS